MPAYPIQAVFMRGGTSKALVFHARDLPPGQAARDAVFLAAMGSPDPSGRQLDGMGGGTTSLSKVCVVGPPTRPDADVDYGFAQVSVREARVDHAGNCGNMSAAIGPFAVDEGLVAVDGDSALVRIHNTNTGKLIHARFPVEQGRAATDGALAIPGVHGTGAPIRLDFLDPGGASTGRLLPTGNAVDRLDIPGHGPVEVSLVDAGNAALFLRAADLGLDGTESPDALQGRPDLLARLAVIRAHASVRMGIAPDLEAAGRINTIPYLALVAPASRFTTLAGKTLEAADSDLSVRVIAGGQPHRALPLTISLCTAIAARVPGTIPAAMLSPDARAILRLGMPSGILAVDATVDTASGTARAISGTLYRTARRLFDGRVWVPRDTEARPGRCPGPAGA